MKDKFQMLEPSELMELYQQYRYTQAAPLQIDRRQISIMAQTIQNSVPAHRLDFMQFSPKCSENLEGKANGTQEEQLRSRHNYLIQKQPLSFQAQQKLEHSSQRIEDHENSVRSSDNNAQIQTLRSSTMKFLFADFIITIKILTDNELKELYSSERSNKALSVTETYKQVKGLVYSPKQQDRSRRKQKFPRVERQTICREGRSQQSQEFELSHKEGQVVVAHTYGLIHTEYVFGSKGGPEVKTKKLNAECPCCKDNRIVNLFSQLKAYYEQHK